MFKNLRKYPVLIALVVLGTLLTCFLTYVNFTEAQGFNPSDDGVILAQAWRIINGELPHSDFISIRPALSGYLHAIYFHLPGDLVPKSRWFVLFEYFVIGASFSYVLINQFKNIDPKIKVSLVTTGTLLIFWLGGLRLLIFPWTTIDALFFTGLGLLFISKSWHVKQLHDKARYNFTMGLVFFSLAGLCRQTFFLLVFVALVFLAIKYLRKKYFKNWVSASLIGVFPILVYFSILLFADGFGDFLSQMQSQTSFYDTALMSHFESLNESHFLLFYIIGLIVAIVLQFSAFQKRQRDYLAILSGCLLIYGINKAFVLSTTQFSDLTPIGFDLFWMYAFYSLINLIILKNKANTTLAVSILLLAWLSSISVGSNNFLFVHGILVFAIVVDSASILRQYIKIVQLKLAIALSFATFVILVSFNSFEIQKEFNYRDVPQAELSNTIDSFSDFGSIQTNANTAQYFQELDTIFNEFEDIQNHFLSVPNNAIIYPIAKSVNPLSLDWLQKAEYEGQEDRLSTELTELIKSERTYFIVEKVDCKRLLRCLCTQDFATFDFIDIIQENSEMIFETRMFKVYRNF